MKTIHENIDALESAMNAVQSHCMFYEMRETESHYLVVLPRGYQIDGVRCSKSIGKIEALKRILEKMEQAWNYTI